MRRFASPAWIVSILLFALMTTGSVVERGIVAVGVAAEPLRYQSDPEWLKLPPGRPEPNRLERRIGYMHGDVAVSSTGDVYVSVQNMWYVNLYLDGRRANADVGIGSEYRDQYAGLQVYAPDGTYRRNVPNAPSDLHGFFIRKETDGEFLYGVRVAATNAPPDQTKADWYVQAVVKMTLDGKVVLSIPATAFPDKYVIRRNGHPFMRLSGLTVGPTGDIYVADGYASDYVHRFDRAGKYLTSFGGKQPPYSFNTLHKLALDTRYSPARIIGVDRANGRVVHLSLDGEFLGVVAQDLRLPAAVAVWGDYAAVAELGGQITVLDKEGGRAAVFGGNDIENERGDRTVEPTRWRPGVTIAPHGIAFTERGDILVSELNIFGRLHRFNRQN